VAGYENQHPVARQGSADLARIGWGTAHAPRDHAVTSGLAVAGRSAKDAQDIGVEGAHVRPVDWHREFVTGPGEVLIDLRTGVVDMGLRGVGDLDGSVRRPLW
jgi:hypothetical protein